jgi:hypothetical protein
MRLTMQKAAMQTIGNQTERIAVTQHVRTFVLCRPWRLKRLVNQVLAVLTHYPVRFLPPGPVSPGASAYGVMRRTDADSPGRWMGWIAG